MKKQKWILGSLPFLGLLRLQGFLKSDLCSCNHVAHSWAISGSNHYQSYSLKYPIPGCSSQCHQHLVCTAPLQCMACISVSCQACPGHSWSTCVSDSRMLCTSTPLDRTMWLAAILQLSVRRSWQRNKECFVIFFLILVICTNTKDSASLTTSALLLSFLLVLLVNPGPSHPPLTLSHKQPHSKTLLLKKFKPACAFDLSLTWLFSYLSPTVPLRRRAVVTPNTFNLIFHNLLQQVWWNQ